LSSACAGVSAEDIAYTNLFTGVHGNYIKPAVVRSGLDPENLPVSDPSVMDFGVKREGSNAKWWRNIW
jgi:nitronate monooxygenase